MNTTWIVVADGTKACSYEYRGPNRALAVVEGSQLQHINEPSRNLVTSPPGRLWDNGPNQRSALETTDPKRHEKEVFARRLGSFLEEHVNDFDDLVIVAPPQMLGDLRQIAPSRVLQKVSHELDKELTNLRPQELPRHLSAVLNINPGANERQGLQSSV